MKLSLVIPTYKKQREVLDQLERLYGFLSRKNPDFELIFVIDGYVDDTKNILERYIKENRLKKISVIGYKENRGKGYAVRYGMRRAKGDIIGFVDADTDIQIRTLGYALKAMKDENTIREVIHDLCKITNKEISKEKEDKIISAIINDKVPKNVDKMF